jgi:hypothetical protein
MSSIARLLRLTRLARLATLPETRHALIAAAHSATVRDIAHRARHDRRGLARDLRRPSNAGTLLRDAVRHPVTRELADAGLLFLPIRYAPIGWALGRVGRRIVRRYADAPVEVIEPSAFGAQRPLRNVTGTAALDPRASGNDPER